MKACKKQIIVDKLMKDNGVSYSKAKWVTEATIKTAT